MSHQGGDFLLDVFTLFDSWINPCDDFVWDDFNDFGRRWCVTDSLVDFLDLMNLMFTYIFQMGDLTNYKQKYRFCSQWQPRIETPFLTYQYK